MKQLGAGKSECRAEENTGHRGEERATLSFSRVSDPPDGIKAETSAKRHAAAVREAAVLLEAAGVAVALAVGLVTHPIRTFALVFHKLAALAAGLALILTLIAWFWTDHTKPDFVPCFWGSIGVIVASILVRMLAEWVLERPTRAERRAMRRIAAPTFDSRL